MAFVYTEGSGNVAAAGIFGEECCNVAAATLSLHIPSTPLPPLLVVTMDHEHGDDYIRRIAQYIRTNEQGLAAAGDLRRRRTKAVNNSDVSVFNPLGWFGTAQDNVGLSSNKPVILSIDAHHLFYLLMRLEAIGLNVGSLDVRVENPSRPMNYVNIPHEKDRSDTLSLRSFASSFSAVSRLSLGGGWWKPPPPTVDSELKYIFSSFTKLPAISLHAPEPRLISELANETPNENAVPLEAFKTIQMLECVDVDPRTLLGWDKLAESLKSLTIRKSGLEDVSDIFIGAVMDDQARREGEVGTERTRRIPKGPPSRQSSFRTTRLPDSVPEDAEETPLTPKVTESPISEVAQTFPSSKQDEATSNEPQNEEVKEEDAASVLDTPRPSDSNPLPSFKWAFLRHLSLSDNALTFLPTSPLPYLTSLTHLDLSSNLLVSVPPGLSALYNLVSLNLSDNMIDSVLGIYMMLGQILTLNLSRNRLESICGLERLLALERVDLRHNIIEETAEVGRLAPLPNIAEVWVEGNPLVDIEEGYRIRCFDLFWKEGKSITLDGSPPGFYEKRYLTNPPLEQMTSSRPASVAYSPPAVPVGAPSPRTNGQSAPAAHGLSPGLSLASSSSPPQTASPQLAAVVGRNRKKKNLRIVNLDGGSDGVATSSGSASHSRGTSDINSLTTSTSTRSPKVRATSPAKPSLVETTSSSAVAGSSTEKSFVAPAFASDVTRKKMSRHSRHYTEFAPVSSNAFEDPSPAPPTPKDDSRPSTTHRRSATMSSRSATRRARVSASVYEPPTESKPFDESAAFRARIEALRSDMGEGWLKVFNQSHLGSPGVPSG